LEKFLGRRGELRYGAKIDRAADGAELGKRRVAAETIIGNSNHVGEQLISYRRYRDDGAYADERESRISSNFPPPVVHDTASVSRRNENRIRRGPFPLGLRRVAAPNVLMFEGVEYRLK
jgi:hypothetical protein